MSPSAVLFDLDGTLVDSSGDIEDAVNQLLTELGWPPLAPGLLAPHIGWGARHALSHAFALSDPARQAPPFLDVRDGFLHAYRQRLDATTRPYPGVLATLDSLASLPLAVVTNKPEDMAIDLLERLGMASHFGAIVGWVEGEERKPHPAPLRRALAALGLGGSSRAWMVGDTEPDLRAGQAAGLRVLLLSHGAAPPAAALLRQADAVASSWDQVLAQLI